jgi:hypothetical protein
MSAMSSPVFIALLHPNNQFLKGSQGSYDLEK